MVSHARAPQPTALAWRDEGAKYIREIEGEGCGNKEGLPPFSPTAPVDLIIYARSANGIGSTAMAPIRLKHVNNAEDPVDSARINTVEISTP